jgi:predicted acyltransferase
MKSERLVSIDFLRGLTVAAMILVNNPGSWDYVYAPLMHAHWHGCSPTDLVFPFFLFIVGLSINYSLSSIKESVGLSSTIFRKIMLRTFILFCLGIFIAAFPTFEWNGLRIPGVLQRIAIVFMIGSLVFLTFSKMQQIVFTSILLVAYWLVMTFIPVPGGDVNNLEPGKNIAAWLDNYLLNGHLWSITKTWDPEGILSTIPAIASVMTGIFAAYILKQLKPAAERTTQLFITGTMLVVGGLILDLIFSINKSLWTSSYVLYTSGLAMFAVAISFWYMDVMQVYRKNNPFIYFGANAISIYVASEILAKLVYFIKIDNTTSLKGYLFDLVNNDFIGPYNASLFIALSWVILFSFMAWIMYKNKIFIKV